MKKSFSLKSSNDLNAKFIERIKGIISQSINEPMTINTSWLQEEHEGDEHIINVRLFNITINCTKAVINTETGDVQFFDMPR